MSPARSTLGGGTRAGADGTDGTDGGCGMFPVPTGAKPSVAFPLRRSNSRSIRSITRSTAVIAVVSVSVTVTASFGSVSVLVVRASCVVGGSVS